MLRFGKTDIAVVDIDLPSPLGGEPSEGTSPRRDSNTVPHSTVFAAASPTLRFAGYDVARVVFALFLIAASLLKAHQVATDIPTQLGLRGALWLKIVHVDFELLFAAWLLANLYPLGARRAALALLGVFVVFAAYGLFTGASTCGCFGKVAVHPGITLALDLALMAAMWRFQPRLKHGADPGHLESTLTARLSLPLSALMIVGSPASLWMMGYSVSPLGLTGSKQILSRAIVLDPTDWVGKQCPLLEHVKFGETDVSDGAWTIIVYDRNCHKCNELIAERKHALLTAGAAASQDQSRIALVDISPSHSRADTVQSLPFANQSLTESVVWAATVPAEVRLQNGIVVGVAIRAFGGE